MTLPANLLQFLRSHRDESVLSVFVEGTDPDPGARKAWRTRLRHALAVARERVGESSSEESAAKSLEEFEQCEVDLLQRLPADGSEPSATGWAFFRSASGESLAFEVLSNALETSARWGIGPAVIPLLRIARPERALVLLIDLEHATLERWSGSTRETVGEIIAEGDVETARKMGGVPRQGFHGGTRGSTQTDDAQRQRSTAHERLRHDARELLIANDDGEIAIVLGGTSASVARLLTELPAAAADRAVEASGLSRRTPPHEALGAVTAALEVLQFRQQRGRVDSLLGVAHATARAAFGLPQARAAAAAGAIEALLFNDAACEADPEGLEEVVRHALASGATVECVSDANLSKPESAPDGVVAALRFPVPDLATNTFQET